MRCGIGWKRNLILRQTLGEIDVGICGEPSYKCSFTLSLKADAYALHSIATYQHGKILMWAWLSRGYVTQQQLADWHFKGSTADLSQAMVKIKGAMKFLLHLDTLPEIDHEQYKGPWLAAATPQAGEVKHAWMLELPNAENALVERPLPQWFNLGVDTAISTWVAQRQKWDIEIQTRAGKGKELTPKMQKLYDAWNNDPMRRRPFQILTTSTPHAPHVCTSVHMYVCMRACMHECMYVHTYVARLPYSNYHCPKATYPCEPGVLWEGMSFADTYIGRWGVGVCWELV